MTAIVYYLTHPQVRIDAGVPVPDWGLSDIGRSRALAAAAASWCAGVTRIVASGEKKAIETAEIFARRRGLAVEVRPAMHENDRSATGYLPPAEFEAIADIFFATPFQSVRGWERAIDAQTRIVDEMRAVLATPTPGDLLVVGHGAVGSLLMAHILKLPISRKLDQLAGGGNVFAFDPRMRDVSQAWRRLEDMSG